MPSPGPKLLSGDEFMVDTTLTYQGGQGSNPAVAYGSSQYLVVWQGNGIIGARVTASGSVLDPSGISIAPSGCFPAVAFDGTNFLVVWCTEDSCIYCARVSPSGIVLDPDGIPVCLLANCSVRPAIAPGDAACLVAWTDGRNGATTDIYGARVNRSGMVLDPDGIPIARDSGNQDEPAVAFDGSEHLVVWRDAYRDSTGDICGARVTPAGVVLDTLGIPISCAASAQANPSVSFGDSVYLVAWDDSGRTASPNIYCTRISPAGRVLDTNGIKVCAIDSAQTNPVTAFDGTDFLLSWTDFRNDHHDGYASDIYGARVTQTGLVLDSMGFPVCTAANYQQMPALVRGDSLCLMVCEDHRYHGAIFGAQINRDGQVLDRTGFISTSVGYVQLEPCAAFTGSSYVVAWEQEGTPYRIRCSRLAPSGNVLDSAPHTLCPPSTGAFTPAVAASETCALVVWADWSLNGVAGARVTQSGAVLDSTWIGIMNGRGIPYLVSVASDSENWLVVWDEGHDIHGARVSASGTVLDTSGILICGAAGDQFNPQIAFGESTYLVVWADDRFDYDYIFASRVTQSGAVLDSNGIQVSFDSAYRDLPRVTFGGTDYLVVWQEQEISGTYNEIYAARLSPNGAIIDSEPIIIAERNYDCESPSVAFDGTDYIVAWLDARSGPGSVSGARVSRWGTVLDTFLVSQLDVENSDLCLASGPSRQVLAVYSAPTDSVNHRPVSCNRIWGRLSPFEGIEENQTQAALCMTLNVLPNPLNCDGIVRYALPVSGHVRLCVYDVSGRLVRLLAEDEQKAGRHALRWDGTASDGRLLANGVYILRLDAGGRTETRTLAIAR